MHELHHVLKLASTLKKLILPQIQCIFAPQRWCRWLLDQSWSFPAFFSLALSCREREWEGTLPQGCGWAEHLPRTQFMCVCLWVYDCPAMRKKFSGGGFKICWKVALLSCPFDHVIAGTQTAEFRLYSPSINLRTGYWIYYLDIRGSPVSCNMYC